MNNKDNVFLTKFPLKIDWEHTITDDNGALRVPTKHDPNTLDIFELYIVNKDGHFTGKILQFMPYQESGETKYHRILFTISGRRESDLQVPRPYINYLQSFSGTYKKTSGKSTQKTASVSTTDPVLFADLYNCFLDPNGNPPSLIKMLVCQEGTLFNSSIEACDWPDLAGENATKTLFSIQYSNSIYDKNVSTYGYVTELNEVIVIMKQPNTNLNSLDFGFLDSLAFPISFSYPTYPISGGDSGGGGTTGTENYAPINSVVELTAVQTLKSLLLLNTAQNNWLIGKEYIANETLKHLFFKDYSPDVMSFDKELINQMMLNSGLNLDVYASYNSPINIDRSTITDATPEGAKFNEVYNSLLKSSEFKKLFIDLFQDNTRYNVEFEIDDHVWENNDPTKKEVHATTSSISNGNCITIKISKQILISGTTMSQTNIENAKTILHECIHAYLFAKETNPTIGMDIVGVLNTMYPTVNEQHDFMYNKMIPTMQNILFEIRNLVTTESKRTILETQYTMHPTQNPLTSTDWIWGEYFKFLSLSGLDETSCFIQDFPAGSDQWNLFGNYINYGHDKLDR